MCGVEGRRVRATYRAEASLYAALAGQLRLGSLAMLGDLRTRVGEDEGAAAATTTTGSLHAAAEHEVASHLVEGLVRHEGGELEDRLRGQRHHLEAREGAPALQS